MKAIDYEYWNSLKFFCFSFEQWGQQAQMDACGSHIYLVFVWLLNFYEDHYSLFMIFVQINFNDNRNRISNIII